MMYKVIRFEKSDQIRLISTSFGYLLLKQGQHSKYTINIHQCPKGYKWKSIISQIYYSRGLLSLNDTSNKNSTCHF